jgi:hypothetical protein
MQSFNSEREIVLIKCHLIRTESSYRKELNLVRLLLISKINYKIVLYETYFNSRLQTFFKIYVAP